MNEVKPYDGKLKTILDLSQAYYNSYVTLSKEYKCQKEMALYKKGTFIKKLKNIAIDKSSITYMYLENNQPLGFIRFSPIEDYYKNTAQKNAQSESGVNNGYNYFWQRKLIFNQENPMSDKTLILNQIYLDPSIQSKGVGRLLLEKTLHIIKKQGYKDFIVEYNTNNTKAKKFYQHSIGLEEIGSTKDFDNIITKPTKICMSPVSIGYTTIKKAMGILKTASQVQQKREGNDR